MKIPKALLKELYVFGSMKNSDEGFHFSLKNTLSKSVMTAVKEVKINGESLDLEKITLKVNEKTYQYSDVHEDNPITFHVGQFVDVTVKDLKLEPEKEYKLHLVFEAGKFGVLTLDLEDYLTEKKKQE